MNTFAVSSSLPAPRWLEPDRMGVIASVLCAIHCALTPVLILVLPAFGQAWSHPASHWGMALFVVPVAAFTLTRGFKQHGRKWVVGTGVFGIALVIVGAAVPYLGEAETPSAPVSPMENTASVSAGECEEADHSECVEICPTECESAQQCESGGECADETNPTSQCEDACCPTLQVDADGGWNIHVPLASILTTLGGISLIATHLGNLCCCSACKLTNQPA